MRHLMTFSSLVLGLALVGAGCTPTAPQPATQQQAFGALATLQVGQALTYADGLSVRLGTIDDSRCPKDVVCVWQGELAPTFVLSGGTLEQQSEVRLGTERARAVTVDDYLLLLDGATPTSAGLTVTKSGQPVAQDDKIRVVNPAPGQVVTSPLVVSGQARGPWYFEASFPVKLLDANGKEVAVTHAQAQGEWMTTEFVPFSSVVNFAKPTTETGTLVLEKDNASGLPEHDDARHIPVRFVPAK